MSNHPSWSCPVDTDVLLLLAWFSTLDLRALLQRKKREQPWKVFRQLLDEALQTALDEALACFRGDPIYGPALLSLARYRISRIDLQRASWAIALEELADPSNGVFFSDDPYHSPASAEKPQSGPVDETEALEQAIAAHVPLARRLHQLSLAWNRDVCCGACELRAFFFLYLDLVQWPLRVPFFLHELLRVSLARIDWHAIAAKVLQVPPGQVCQCETSKQQEPLGAKAAYLAELFHVVSDEIGEHSRELPEPQRTQALFLLDLCRETTRPCTRSPYRAQKRIRLRCADLFIVCQSR